MFTLVNDTEAANSEIFPTGCAKVNIVCDNSRANKLLIEKIEIKHANNF